MNEKLIIKNFGPIKHIELELKKFNILIGEQATGKSTVAKMLNFCRYFSIIANGSNFEMQKQNLGMSEIDTHLSKWGLLDYIKPDSFVEYTCEDYIYSFSNSKFNIIPPLPQKNEYSLADQLTSRIQAKSTKFENLLTEYYELEKTGKLSYEFYSGFVSKVMDNPFYLPAERGLQSIFSLGKDSLQNISDSLFNLFAKIDGILRSFKNETKIEPLKISYKNQNGKGFIKSSKHKYIALANAATGFQTAIPIVLLIKYYTGLRKKKKTFIIEEPEENLFPTAQYELVKFFAENMANVNGYLITTHSPYILTSLNNLILANKAGLKNDNINKVINQKNWIRSEDVVAYQLRYNSKDKGTIAESIIDKDGLIEAEKIDEVSSILNKEFEKIMFTQLDIKR
ncbi:MAG: AAA family ATPase [Chitinophagaceae bacterium]|jgi:predicted ATPase|nr:AAA family ATPase [Chitinophagaceae bacterium]